MAEEKKVYLNRLILHEDNPRFEGVLNEEKAIGALCGSEKILELAKDIAENGIVTIGALHGFPRGSQ